MQTSASWIRSTGGWLCVSLILFSVGANASAQVVVTAPDIAARSARDIPPSVLSTYVAKPDDSFGYELAETGDAENCAWLRYNLMSQTWQGIPWRHIMWVILPTQSTAKPNENDESNPPNPAAPYELSGDSAILFIGGGSWKTDWAKRPPLNVNLPKEYPVLASLATRASAPVILLEHVPFQPILDGRFEDAIIAETFRRFLMGEGDDWPLLLPMVKSAVRCMDVAQEQMQQRFQHPIARFTVSGASKRGWTTWLTAAVDSRVDAIAPIVIDMLNMPKQMEHQLETWGTYSDEIDDYTTLELPKYLASPRGELLQQIVDPYSYRQALDLPKLLIFGTNDRYWTLDACNIYWDDLVGPKNLLYVPNNGHSIKDFDRLISGLTALHTRRKTQQTLPEVDWSYQALNSDSGRLTVKLEEETLRSSLWIARSKTKDFRSAQWVAIPMIRQSDGRFSAEVNHQADTHVAFFAEVVIGNPENQAYLSTNVTILSKDGQ